MFAPPTLLALLWLALSDEASAQLLTETLEKTRTFARPSSTRSFGFGFGTGFPTFAANFQAKAAQAYGIWVTVFLIVVIALVILLALVIWILIRTRRMRRTMRHSLSYYESQRHLFAKETNLEGGPQRPRERTKAIQRRYLHRSHGQTWTMRMQGFLFRRAQKSQPQEEKEEKAKRIVEKWDPHARRSTEEIECTKNTRPNSLVVDAGQRTARKSESDSGREGSAYSGIVREVVEQSRNSSRRISLLTSRTSSVSATIPAFTVPDVPVPSQSELKRPPPIYAARSRLQHLERVERLSQLWDRDVNLSFADTRSSANAAAHAKIGVPIMQRGSTAKIHQVLGVTPEERRLPSSNGSPLARVRSFSSLAPYLSLQSPGADTQRDLYRASVRIVDPGSVLDGMIVRSPSSTQRALP